MKLIAAILGACVAAVTARQAVLPQQWTADTTSAIAINQGGEPGADGSLCCPAESPGCKIQTAFEAGKMYFDFPNNRSATMSPNGAGVVTLYNLGKEFQVAAGGACQAWCPVQGPMQPFSLANATDLGPTTYKGQKVEAYFQRTAIPILNITMETATTYVVLSTTGGYDTPVAQVTDIEPFGQQLGQSTETWGAFTPGAPPASIFTVTGIDSCKKAQCGGDGDGSSSSAHHEEDGGADLVRRLSSEDVRQVTMEYLESTSRPAGYSGPSYLIPRPSLEL